MANTEDFSSLDPLGPEYGRSDLPTMDSKGLSAFEGDELKDPIINFPIVPKIQNLELPQHDVRKYIVNHKPAVKGAPGPKMDFNELFNAKRNHTLAKMATGADKSTYGKIYSYNAGPDGNAFYDRYAAYGPETFAKVGFSPLRDNEALFNSRTTMWDDHKRMMQNSFWPLFANGFVAGPKSLGKMLTGDFTGTDLEESRAYTDAAAIGQTTKSGWGMGFANNLLMNFAYSAGIITEAIAEEAVAIALAPETMGGSVFLATANATRNLSKLGTGFKLLKGVEATKDVTNGLRAVNNTLKAVDNVKDARTFWQSAKAAATSTMSPLKNTFTNLGDINQIVTKGGKSYNLTNLAKIYKTAGGFYKDVRNFNMALSEARLEAGIVENQIYDNGYNQYYDKFGEAPSDKVQKELLRNAKEGSLDTLYWNTALIYVSNSITFNNLLGPKGGVGGFMRNTMKEVTSVGGGKFGSLGKVIYNQSKKVFQFQANTAKGLVKSWASQPIYKSAMGTLGYFKSNFTEGIQENLQEVISGANEKYYSDSFEQSAIRSHEYHKGLSRYNVKSQNKYLTEEFKGQFSARGAETFASGFFMGMLAAPLNAAVPNMLVGYNRMFNKEAYQKFKADKLEITKGVIENLNSIGIKEFLDNKIFNLSTQEAVATIKRTGTKKEAHDADMEGFVKQMSHVLRNGVMDVYLEKLQAEKQFSPEEFEGRVPNIPKGEGAKYLAKIDDVVARAKKLEKRYKYYTDKHPNPVTAANLPPINTPEYEDAIALHAAWEDGIEKAIYFNEAFENTMQRKVDIESTFVAEAPLKNMSSRDSAVLFNDKELQNEIGLLKNEIDSLKDLTDPKSQEQYAAKVRKLAVMEKLYSASTGFKNFFNRYDNAEQVRAALQKDKGSEPVTDEEVEAALSSVLGEFTEDNKEKIKTDYEGAYKEYLQELASVNGDYIFDEKIDKSFGLIIDHFALDHESGRLIKYVNLLHDPQGFLDMVDRNRQWMKDLYKKRGKIYEKMVTEELNMVISNSLLNALANEGIYVSVEAFEEWEENGVPPEEFFDNTRKLIVPKGTPDYDIFYQLFEQASELKNEKTNPLRESLDEELKATLDTLDEQLEKELESVPKIDSKVEVATIEMENDIPITVNKINTELGPNQYAEALVTTEEGGKETTLFFKHEDGTLRYNNETGAVVKGATLKETFEKVNIFSMESVADPAYAQPIIDRYNDLKAEAIQEYALNKEKLEEEDTTPKEEFVPITTDMEPDAMPATLYNELYKLFKEQYLKKLNSEEFVNMTAEEERNVFRTFIQGSKEAKKIIEDFNAEVQLKADAIVTKNTAEKEDFDFLYQGKTVNTASIKTIAELRKYQERFKKSLKTLEEVKSPTAEDIAQRQSYQILIADFEKLITTRSKANVDISEGEAVSVFTPRKLFKARLDRIKENQEGKRRAGYTSSAEGYVVSLNSDTFNETDNQGRPINVGAEVYLNDKEISEITRIKAKRKGGFINSSQESEALQQVYRDAFKRALDTYEIVEDAEFETEVKDRRSKYNATTTDTKADIEKRKEEDLAKLESIKDQIGDAFNLKESSNALLKSIYKFMSSNFNWKFEERKGNLIKFSKESGNTEFNIDGLDVDVEGTATVMGGSRYNAEIDPYDIIEAKYEAELAALGTDTKADIEKQKESYKKQTKGTPINKDAPKGIKIGDKNDDRLSIITIEENFADNFDAKKADNNGQGYEVISKVIEYGEMENGVQTKAPKVETMIFNNKADADAFFVAQKAKLDKYIADAELAALEGTETNNTEDGEIIPSETEEITEVFVADSDRVTVAMIKDQLDKANTAQEVQTVVDNLNISVASEFVFNEDITEMVELIKAKKESLVVPQDMPIISESLEKGTELVAKKNIFTGAKNIVYATQDSILMVTNVDTVNKTVSVKALNSNKTIKIKFSDMNENFGLKTNLMNGTEKPDEPLTSEDKTFVSESIDLTTTFIEDKTKIDAIEKAASAKTIQELEDDLLEDIFC